MTMSSNTCALIWHRCDSVPWQVRFIRANGKSGLEQHTGITAWEWAWRRGSIPAAQVSSLPEAVRKLSNQAIMSDELEGIWKEAVKLLCHHLLRGTEKNHIKPQSKYLVSWLCSIPDPLLGQSIGGRPTQHVTWNFKQAHDNLKLLCQLT
jgi:hypothetical protein